MQPRPQCGTIQRSQIQGNAESCVRRGVRCKTKAELVVSITNRTFILDRPLPGSKVTTTCAGDLQAVGGNWTPVSKRRMKRGTEEERC